MFRLIYFNASFGYKGFDYKDDTQYTLAEQTAKSQDAAIICVVDYQNKAILKKCPDFNMHLEHIDHIIFDPKVMGLYY